MGIVKMLEREIKTKYGVVDYEKLNKVLESVLNAKGESLNEKIDNVLLQLN